MRKLVIGLAVLAVGSKSSSLAVADESVPAPEIESAVENVPELIFPIAGEERAEPKFAEGKFGAYRPGRSGRRDCGRGHCGIDLCATMGSPVMVVMDGVVAQIDRSQTGEGGSWIRVEHPNGKTTWYMHLARIREGIKVGADVHAGETIATLGRTGVTTSPTHLHFALTVGKPGRERHLDPTSFLEKAALVAAPVDPEPKKPKKALRSEAPDL